jgi:hypothetical protein
MSATPPNTEIRFRYKLPTWGLTLFALVTPPCMYGALNEAMASTMRTRTGEPMNPIVMWVMIGVLALFLLFILVQLFVNLFFKHEFVLGATALTKPKHTWSASNDTIAYESISEVEEIFLGSHHLKVVHAGGEFRVLPTLLPNAAALKTIYEKLREHLDENRPQAAKSQRA